MAIESDELTKLVEPIEWFVDSDASSHICRDRRLFGTYKLHTSMVERGTTVQNIIGIEIVRLCLIDNSGSEQVLYLNNVYCVPELKDNLRMLQTRRLKYPF